jgi:hypothetical protein
MAGAPRMARTTGSAETAGEPTGENMDFSVWSEGGTSTPELRTGRCLTYLTSKYALLKVSSVPLLWRDEAQQFSVEVPGIP